MDSKSSPRMEEVVIYEAELEGSDSSITSANGTIEEDQNATVEYSIQQISSKNQLLPYQTQFPRRMKKITGTQGLILRQQRRLKRKRRVLACMNAISEESRASLEADEYGAIYDWCYDEHELAKPGSQEHSFDDIEVISAGQIHYEDADEDIGRQNVSSRLRLRLSRLKSRTVEAITRSIYAV
ncbi:hypothetical protein TRVA0_036S00892 [Trichomonascus vanleenenianus]|uniref:uncharacterized protein n=1 Tax=Trichomonascus vanleenenianus TaxID=2268995 RepID=UPI003ECA5650